MAACGRRARREVADIEHGPYKIQFLYASVPCFCEPKPYCLARLVEQHGTNFTAWDQFCLSLGQTTVHSTTRRRGSWAKPLMQRARHYIAQASRKSFTTPSWCELSRRPTRASAIRFACAMPDWLGSDTKAKRANAGSILPAGRIWRPRNVLQDLPRRAWQLGNVGSLIKTARGRPNARPAPVLTAIAAMQCP
jgi:hypothetical protein